MRSKYVKIICIVCFLFMTACAPNIENEYLPESHSESEEKESQENINIPNEYVELNEEILPLAQYKNTEFVMGEDYQYFFGGNVPIAASDKGYYYVTEYGYLCFIDKSTNANVYVCSKVNCTHSTEECSAYLAGVKPELNIWFYQNYIYYVTYNGENLYSLHRVSENGEQKEKVTDLFRFGSVNISANGEVMLHRGNIYYSLDNMDGSCTLYMRNLQSPETEFEIYKESEGSGDIYRIRGYGEGVCFEAGHRTADGYEGSLYYYNIAEQTVTEVYSGVYKNYIIADGVLIYSDEEQIWRIDLISGERSTFLEDGYSYGISYDGEYVYLDNVNELMMGNLEMEDHAIFVYTMEGEKKGQISVFGVDPCGFGDSQNLFCLELEEEPDGRYFRKFSIISKESIINGDILKTELIWR